MDLAIDYKSDREFRSLVRWSGNLINEGRYFCSTLKEWLDNGKYKHHYNTDKQRWYGCETFSEFMETSPPNGLGLSAKDALKDLDLLVRAGIEGASEIQTQWFGQDPALRLPEQEIGKGKSGPGRGNKTDSNTTRFNDRGQTYTKRRLARDHPELLKRVGTGELTANAAAIQAGFRHPMIQVRADDINAALDKLERHYNVRLGGVI